MTNKSQKPKASVQSGVSQVGSCDWLGVMGIHQVEDSNACYTQHGKPSRVPDSINARALHSSASSLLAKMEVGEESLARWDKTEGVFLSVLLPLWIKVGRPEIEWPTLDGLPASGSGKCILQSYLENVAMTPNVES